MSKILEARAIEAEIEARFGADPQTPQVLSEVATERRRQNKKFGPQSHPMGNNPRAFGPMADMFRSQCDAATKDGKLSWAMILLEEVYEALAAETDEEIEEELTQVAAVAVYAVEDLRKRRGGA